jgi:glycosyltransferase involved in cell wall biosynthesis
MGVQHFYLIDNGSDDNYLPKIVKYINQGIITLNIDNKRHAQVELYNKYYLNKCKENSKWVMVVDLDEFVYSRNGYNTIREYLSSVKNVSQIVIPWKMFGSNGHITQPDSVIKNFTKRDNIPNEGSIINGKCITKCKYLKQLHQHKSELNSKKKCNL